jgi:hypothetical protein
MRTHVIAVIFLSATALGTAQTFAETPAGSPADPNSLENRQPGPSATTPTDPAAGAEPSARVPTAPAEGEMAYGGGAATYGTANGPAGIPADPNSTENRQPGPSATTPTDPAAGEDDEARQPTAPIE